MKTASTIEPKDIRDFDSLYEFIEYFNNEKKCIDYLAKIRWNGKPQCPYCGCDKSYRIKTQQRWKCASCRKQYSVRIGTVFEESRISLRKWFIAIFLFTSHKKGISSHQLARDLKITQKTAWFLLSRIRKLFEPDPNEQFDSDSVVLIDETFVGGNDRNRHKEFKVGASKKRYENTKLPVLGILEKQGKVYAVPIQNLKNATFKRVMQKKVKEGATIYTDALQAYQQVLKGKYKHEFVNHAADEYVRGDVSTNELECFWSHFKRTIFGVYHHTSEVHLGKYVNECTFRFNNRKLSEGSRFDVALANSKGRLTYKELTSERYGQKEETKEKT